MGLAMVREYLSIVRSTMRTTRPSPQEASRRSLPRFVKLGGGAVNWRRALGALKTLGFRWAISVHTEYEFDEPIIRGRLRGRHAAKPGGVGAGRCGVLATDVDGSVTPDNPSRTPAPATRAEFPLREFLAPARRPPDMRQSRRRSDVRRGAHLSVDLAASEKVA